MADVLIHPLVIEVFNSASEAWVPVHTTAYNELDQPSLTEAVGDATLMAKMFGESTRLVSGVHGNLIYTVPKQEQAATIKVTGVEINPTDPNLYSVRVASGGVTRRFTVHKRYIWGRTTQSGVFDNRSDIYCLWEEIERQLKEVKP